MIMGMLVIEGYSNLIDARARICAEYNGTRADAPLDAIESLTGKLSGLLRANNIFANSGITWVKLYINEDGKTVSYPVTFSREMSTGKLMIDVSDDEINGKVIYTTAF